MQSAFLGIFTFSSTLYNLGRILLVVLFIIGIVIGVKQEEEYLNQFEDYKRYKQVVRNKFVCDLFNAFNPEVKSRLNGKTN